MEQATQNTLDLARKGDPAAIAVILTYHLSQHSNTTASAIRLGDYLSVLIDAHHAAPQERLVNLILSILRDLEIQGIQIIEISARQMNDPERQWSQTIELTDLSLPPATMTEPTPADVAPAGLPDAPSDSRETSLYAFLQRPEMVALLAFAIVLVLWDAYQEWMEESDLTQRLTGVRLARRLGVSTHTLNRLKRQTNFSEWSRDRDPDGIAWTYANNLFVPQIYSYPPAPQALAGSTH